MRHLDNPEDITGLVVFLASDRASWINSRALGAN
jgi:NAD(P)-dependent dehydrogenase (short-subunit alcohol dehydrogenase family)